MDEFELLEKSWSELIDLANAHADSTVDKFRYNDATGELYEYHDEQRDYVFCGHVNVKNKLEFINDNIL